MRFESAHILYFLWMLIPLGLFFVWANKRYLRHFHAFIEAQVFAQMVPQSNRKLRQQKMIFLSVVFIFALIALARPQWGFQWQEVKRKGIDLLIVVDTSKSMLTQDVRPNRLERTKLAVLDLLKKLKGDRIGLIAFAGDAFLMCPLTVDYDGFRLSLDNLNVNSVPRGGTNLSRAIAESLKHHEEGSENYRAIIIVTDGDNLEGDPLEMAKEARKLGVKIYTIGIGTREGDLIQVRDSSGTNQFLKDSEGNYIKSRLNERLLQKIALETGGIYVKSSGAQFGLDLIYERDLAQLEKREFDAQKQKRYFERFQIPLAIALLFLLYETCLGLRLKS